MADGTVVMMVGLLVVWMVETWAVEKVVELAA